jgi:hypothetical protein
MSDASIRPAEVIFASPAGRLRFARLIARTAAQVLLSGTPDLEAVRENPRWL